MKELDPVSQDKKLDQVEIVVEQQQKKEIKLIGRQVKKPGLTLWEYNQKTKVLDKAKFKKDTLVLNTLDPQKVNGQEISYKVIVNDNCYYEQALNYRNAVKQFKKLGFTQFLPF